MPDSDRVRGEALLDQGRPCSSVSATPGATLDAEEPRRRRPPWRRRPSRRRSPRCLVTAGSDPPAPCIRKHGSACCEPCGEDQTASADATHLWTSVGRVVGLEIGRALVKQKGGVAGRIRTPRRADERPRSLFVYFHCERSCGRGPLPARCWERRVARRSLVKERGQAGAEAAPVARAGQPERPGSDGAITSHTPALAASRWAVSASRITSKVCRGGRLSLSGKSRLGSGRRRTAARRRSSRRTRCWSGPRRTGGRCQGDPRCRRTCAARCSPRCPMITSRPSPQVGRPWGVYQSTRT